MNQRLFLQVVLAAISYILLVLAPLHAEDEWTEADSSRLARAYKLFYQQDYKYAENICLQLLESYPSSPTVANLHIQILNAEFRYTEAISESRKVVESDPTEPTAHRWLGISLVRAGDYAEAIQHLKYSLRLDPDDDASATWLAYTYIRLGNHSEADQILENVFQKNTRSNTPELAASIGSVFREIGDSDLAILWWERAAASGSKDAARCLAWAYSEGYGVPADVGNSAYWSRRGDDPYPWFKSFRLADDLPVPIRSWFLVLIIFLSAALLPVASIGSMGLLASRHLTADTSVHWAERARASYPFQVFLGSCMSLTPLLCAASSYYYPSFLLPMPNTLLFWVTYLVASLSTNGTVVLLARRYRKDPGSALQNLQSFWTIILLYLPVPIILITMALNLPSRWGFAAALTLAAALLAYFWIQFGGLLRLARIFHLAVPADSNLTQAATALAGKIGCPPPTVWLLRWNKANAVALMFAHAILVTTRLRQLLTPEEMNSVLAHELAHLNENLTTRLIRLLSPLLLFPFFTLSLWWTPGAWAELIACYVVLFFVLFLVRRRQRQMEVRADATGHRLAEEETAYPRALAKLYEDNLAPAVMRGKRKVHPHLYDRLLASGFTPDYPRPKPPGNWGSFLALFTVAANAAFMASIWLALF